MVSNYGISIVTFAIVLCSVSSEEAIKNLNDVAEPLTNITKTLQLIKREQVKIEDNVKLLLEVARGSLGKKLITAAGNGDLRQSVLLINAGASVEYQDSMNNRPIHVATEHKQQKIMEILIENEADVNAHGRYGYTPLHWTAYNGCLSCAKLLLEKGAEVDSREEWMSTPLMVSAQYGHLDIVELLLSKGANVNAGQQDHLTALHMAARDGRITIVKVLLKNGADRTLKTSDGHTPSDFADIHNQYEIASLLKSKS